MIITIYQVEVKIPNEVWERFGHTKEYEQRMIEAKAGNGRDETQHYSDVFEIADFNEYVPAVECEKKIMGVIEYFLGKLQD